MATEDFTLRLSLEVHYTGLLSDYSSALLLYLMVFKGHRTYSFLIDQKKEG